MKGFDRRLVLFVAIATLTVCAGCSSSAALRVRTYGDVALLVPKGMPEHVSRTITICEAVKSSGVYLGDLSDGNCQVNVSPDLLSITISRARRPSTAAKPLRPAQRLAFQVFGVSVRTVTVADMVVRVYSGTRRNTDAARIQASAARA